METVLHIEASPIQPYNITLYIDYNGQE